MTPLERSSIIATETRLIPKSKRERKMSQQEQKSFLVKLVGGFVVAFLGFVLVVNLPSPQDVRLPSLPKAPTVTKVAKSTPRYRGLEETRTKKKSKAEILKEFEMVQAYRARKARIENGTASTWDHILNTPL